MKTSQLSAMAAAVSRMENQQVSSGSESATLVESAQSEVRMLRAALSEAQAEVTAAKHTASSAVQEAERWGSEHGAGVVAVDAAEGESGLTRLVCCSELDQRREFGESLTTVLCRSPQNVQPDVASMCCNVVWSCDESHQSWFCVCLYINKCFARCLACTSDLFVRCDHEL